MTSSSPKRLCNAWMLSGDGQLPSYLIPQDETLRSTGHRRDRWPELSPRCRVPSGPEPAHAGGRLGLISRLARRLSRSTSTLASLNFGVGSGPRRASRTPQGLVEYTIASGRAQNRPIGGCTPVCQRGMLWIVCTLSTQNHTCGGKFERCGQNLDNA